MQVVLLQPMNVVIERKDARRRQIPRLPHASAHHFPYPSGFADEFGLSCEHGTNRSAQPLGQANGNAVELGANSQRAFSGLYQGIENSRPIEVQFQPSFQAEVADRLHLARGVITSPSFVRRVLQNDELTSQGASRQPV